MPKVYAREKGSEIRIGNHGIATHDRAIVVPSAVAAELAANPRVTVERDEPEQAAPKKKPTPEVPAPEAGKE